MNRLCLRAALAFLCISAAPHLATSVMGNQFVRLDYNLTLANRSRSTAFIELFDDRPLTVTNFLQYVDAGLYDETFMHRLARNFVLQGGGFYPVYQAEPAPINVSLDPFATVDLDGNPNTSNPTVNNEFANLPFRSNVKGTLAMAKGATPDSASNQWFVNLANNSANLDNQNGGFTVFAQVVGDGMTYFDALNGGLQIVNLNEDANDNGLRDAGPFYNNSTDGVPVIPNTLTLAVLVRADRVDYLGAGSVTNVPGGGLAFTTKDAFIDTGASFTGTGPLVVGAGRTLGVRENFSVGRQLTNHGTVEPGLQLGAISATSYLQSSTGTLNIQLRGTTSDTFDSLFVIGAAQLDGKLDVSLINQYMPTHGNSFTVLSAASISGEFDAIDLPLLTAGLVWNVSETATSITLGVSKTDFNMDGVANLADYVVWRNLLGQTGAGLAADANGDMVVDSIDLAFLQHSFGGIRGNVAVGAGSVAAVPEPSAAALFAIALAAIVCRRFFGSAPQAARRG